jgi:hypothetical protein
MPISFFITSVLFVLAVMRVRHIRLLSPYGIFLIFQILYNIMPWITASLGIGAVFFSLLSNGEIVGIQLYLATSANFCFGIVCLFFYREARFAAPCGNITAGMRRNYLLLTVPLFFVTCVLCKEYGWHQFSFAQNDASGLDIAGGMYSVTAYFKYSFVGVYLYYLYRFGLDKGAWILLGEHAIVMVIDGGRTTFVQIFLITIFMFLDDSFHRKRKWFIYILALIGFLAAMLTRASVFEDKSNAIKDVIIPVAVEGSMGSYASLQSIQGMKHLPSPNYTYGTNYFLDPFIWFLPQSLGRDKLLLFNGWVDSLYPVLDENFDPTGGYYYISDAVAAFSYLGPEIVTTLFALALVWVDQHKNSYRLFYITWMPTIGLMFIKFRFANLFKDFVVEFLCIYCLYLASKLKIVRKAKSTTLSASVPSPLPQL